MTPNSELVSWEDVQDDELMTRTSTWPERAKALIVLDAATCIRAAEMLKGIKDLRKEVDEAFDSIIAKAFAAHKEAVGKKRQAEAPLIEAEQLLKRSLAVYETEQERLRQIEQRRLEAIAREEEETRRLNEAADLERQALAGPEPDLDALYDAHQLLEQPIDTPSVVLPKATPKVAGVSYREVWRADVTDIKTLCRAIADGSQPSSLVTANMTALNGIARSLKSQARVPGVRFVSEKTVAAGGR
jgi:hypothetical protein